MLDVVARRVDHAGHEGHAVGQWSPLEAGVLVGVTGVGHRDDEGADLRLVEQWKDLVERNVVGVRPGVVAPADVETDVARVDPFERAVDGVDHQLDPVEEVRERSVGEQRVPLHGEVGGVDLEQQALVDDVPVLGPQRGGDGADVLLGRWVVAVLHRRRDDPGRRRGHERLRERCAGDERALGGQLASVAVRDLADGGGRGHQVDLHALVPRERELDVVGVLDEVAHERPLARPAEARHAVLHVGEEALPGLLAVVADVDADVELGGDRPPPSPPRPPVGAPRGRPARPGCGGRAARRAPSAAGGCRRG